MRKRSYFLPIFVILVIITGIAFLTVSLTRDPYSYAIQKGDAAMEDNNYIKAISEYTIAQTLNANQAEPYTKALTAIANSNDITVVRDMLQTINNCIGFCGVGSISEQQILDAIEILISKNNKQAAYEILNHLHFSYSDSQLIEDKFLSLQAELYPDMSENAEDDLTLKN